MIANTNDGSGKAPELRLYLNLGNLEDLPEFSTGPRGKGLAEQLAAIRQAGYRGAQSGEVKAADLELYTKHGLGRCAGGRVNLPNEANDLAAKMAANGQECVTIHLGWGMENEDQGARLIEAVLQASVKHKIPIYPETHRATLFQDLWRTVHFVEKFPELRFNGDFSHWYTGLEMVYGGFENKLAFIAPVLERVRFVHGRIGNPSSMQVNVGDGNPDRFPFVGHFRELWTAAFRGFLKTAQKGDYLIFAPELLAPRIYYARVFPDANGQMREETDRWAQALILNHIATDCFATALRGA